jgi:hypothetical protein
VQNRDVQERPYDSPLPLTIHTSKYRLDTLEDGKDYFLHTLVGERDLETCILG